MKVARAEQREETTKKKSNDKIADICSVNKSGTVFQDISDELVHIKKTLGDIEDKVSEIADAQNKEY